jgi:branched-chain amino acid aminotransferase
MGYDEALLLDHNGYVAEGPGENIFFISGNRIVTPRLGKVLRGITRQAVITLAQDLNYEVEERNVTPHELDGFEAAFFTGTAAEISPIKQIGTIAYDTSKGNDIAEAFHATATGKGTRSQEWLSWC